LLALVETRRGSPAGAPDFPTWSGRRDSNSRLLAWEASTLPLSYTRPNHAYFHPGNRACKGGVLASSKMPPEAPTDLKCLVEGYRLCASSEGKSPNTIDIVNNSVNYLYDFLHSACLPTDVGDIGPWEIRAFILHLQQKRCFSNHPFSHPQERGLSSHTVNCYLRSIRAFWSWLAAEGIVDINPFTHVRLPRTQKKIIPTFSPNQVFQLFSAIDRQTPEGYRDYAIILTLLDTALRVSELIGIRMDDLWLDQGLLKVLGKGGKERLIPIGREVQRVLWRYVYRHRARPRMEKRDFLFITRDGDQVTKSRLEILMKKYGQKAGITGVRCSPHTLRHTAAITFLRNGGDVFSLQRILGHTTLEMTRHYCELADVDVKRAHLTASPVDNLRLAIRALRVPGGLVIVDGAAWAMFS
jgi:site-specific recombinase XerD